jgi:hypothetical protein
VKDIAIGFELSSPLPSPEVTGDGSSSDRAGKIVSLTNLAETTMRTTTSAPTVQQHARTTPTHAARTSAHSAQQMPLQTEFASARATNRSHGMRTQPASDRAPHNAAHLRSQSQRLHRRRRNACPYCRKLIAIAAAAASSSKRDALATTTRLCVLRDAERNDQAVGAVPKRPHTQ